MSRSLVLPRPAIDVEAFTDAAARLAGAVAIVAWGDAVPQGLLVRAVSLLSTRPARVLFGVDKQDAQHEALLQAEECSLNLLSDADEVEAERFAMPERQETRFDPERWRLQAGQPPRLIASAVHLTGFVDQKIDAGSHSLFVVRVTSADVKDTLPLVYFNRGFRRLQPPRQGAGAQVCAMLEA